MLALAAAAILPNLVFLTGLITDIGLPTRLPIIPLYLILFIIARNAPPAWTFLILATVVAIDCAWTIAAAFNLSPLDLVAAVSFASELKVAASPGYVAGIAFVGLCIVLTGVILVGRREALREASLVPSTLAVLALLVLDGVLTYIPNYHARLFGTVEGTVESAAARSGFRDSVLADRERDSVIVIVEALGQFRDPVLREFVFAPLRAPRLLEAYEVATGSVPFESSTTAAELRELCSTRVRYDALTEPAARDCLPRLLVAQGRETVAVHGFTPRMFDRAAWYPLVGFRTLVFGYDLAAALPRRCGSVFIGICDADIVPVLPELGPPRRPGRLIYWLTLNTHVPVRSGEAQPRFDCATTGGPFGNEAVCAMAELWLEVMAGVATLALDARMHAPDILIVGDHIPPLWSRRGRGMFVPDSVPWVRLTPRS